MLFDRLAALLLTGRFRLVIAMVASVVSSAAIGLTVSEFIVPKPGLANQIHEVEGAIRNLRNVEDYLEKTKDEMAATKLAKERIEEEYHKAQQLEAMTATQIEAISLAVNRRTLSDVIMSNLWGFVLGVAGSLVASYAYGAIKRRIVAA